MTKPRPIRRPQPSEEGYILIAVIFLLALLVLAMSIALPNIIKQIERDREVETMHRGKQYVRALKLYHKKFGNYPLTIDALTNTNQIRFLRKKYIDPSTGKDEWKPIHLGQNKQPTAFGFFGKPMASMMGGVGMGCGGNGLGSGIGSSGSSSSSFGSSSFGSSSFGSSSFGSSSMGSSSFGSSSFGSSGLNSSSNMGSNSPIGGCPTDASGATAGASGASGNPGDPSNPSNPNGANEASGNSNDASGGNNGAGSTDSGSSSGSSSSGSSLNTSSLGGSSSGLSGQTLGGGGIIGVSPGSPKKTILLYKKQNHYNQWEFVYDPAQDQMFQVGGGATGLQQSGSMPNSNGSSPGGFGSSPSGFGSTGGFGSSSGGFGSSPGGFGNSGNSNSGSGSSGSGSNSGSNPYSPPQ